MKMLSRTFIHNEVRRRSRISESHFAFQTRFTVHTREKERDRGSSMCVCVCVCVCVCDRERVRSRELMNTLR